MPLGGLSVYMFFLLVGVGGEEPQQHGFWDLRWKVILLRAPSLTLRSKQSSRRNENYSWSSPYVRVLGSANCSSCSKRVLWFRVFTLNPKPLTLNPKPGTLNPKPSLHSPFALLALSSGCFNGGLPWGLRRAEHAADPT